MYLSITAPSGPAAAPPSSISISSTSSLVLDFFAGASPCGGWLVLRPARAAVATLASAALPTAGSSHSGIVQVGGGGKDFLWLDFSHNSEGESLEVFRLSHKFHHHLDQRN